MAHYTLNGNQTGLSDGLTIEDIIDNSGLSKTDRAAVIINGQVLSRQDWKDTVIKAGDTVEIISIAAGG